jgi:Na+-driven multidrug efflux pump
MLTIALLNEKRLLIPLKKILMPKVKILSNLLDVSLNVALKLESWLTSTTLFQRALPQVTSI